MNRADGVTEVARFFMPEEDVATAHLYQARTRLLTGRPEEEIGQKLRIRTKITPEGGVWENFTVSGFKGKGESLVWVVDPANS